MCAVQLPLYEGCSFFLNSVERVSNILTCKVTGVPLNPFKERFKRGLQKPRQVQGSCNWYCPWRALKENSKSTCAVEIPFKKRRSACYVNQAQAIYSPFSLFTGWQFSYSSLYSGQLCVGQGKVPEREGLAIFRMLRWYSSKHSVSMEKPVSRRRRLPHYVPPPELHHCTKFTEYPAGGAGLVVNLPKFLSEQSSCGLCRQYWRLIRSQAFNHHSNERSCLPLVSL